MVSTVVFAVGGCVLVYPFPFCPFSVQNVYPLPLLIQHTFVAVTIVFQRHRPGRLRLLASFPYCRLLLRAIVVCLRRHHEYAIVYLAKELLTIVVVLHLDIGRLTTH